MYTTGTRVRIISALDPSWIGKEGNIIRASWRRGNRTNYNLDIGGGDWLHSQIEKVEMKNVPIKNINFEDKPEEMEVLPFDPTSKVLTQNDIWNACRDLAEVLIAKNHDYGNSVQDQFNEYGLTSILIRLDDKMKRLKTLAKKEQQVKDETLEDTLQDLAGYAELGLICLKLSKMEE